MRFIFLKFLVVCQLLIPTLASTQTQTLAAGWSMVGNDAGATLDVGVIFGNATSPTSVSSSIVTVWSWNNPLNKWNFFTPSMTSQELATYANSKGYGVLSTISRGEGFWINAKNQFIYDPNSYSGVVNVAPVANAGAAQNVVTGSIVNLDGSGSFDANNDTLTFTWTITKKPISSLSAFSSSSTSIKPTFIPDVDGTYEVTLTVNDGKVDGNTSTTVITSTDAIVTDYGRVVTKIGAKSGIKSILTQPDGKIIAAGIADEDFAIVRYNKDGSFDTNFGGTGIVTTNIYGRVRSTDWVRGAAIQSDGKIILCGYTTGANGSPEYSVVIVRYNQDGSIDLSFGVNGKVILTNSTVNLFCNSMAIQTDGKIIVAGSVNLYNRYTPGYGTLLIRYNSDGSIDSGFGSNGFVMDETTNGVQGLSLQTDGKMLVVGGKEILGNTQLALARYTIDGTLDTTFAGTGFVNTEVGSEIGASNSGTSIAIQTDGKILAAGTSTSPTKGNEFALVRYHASGALDASFGIGGQLTTHFQTHIQIWPTLSRCRLTE